MHGCYAGNTKKRSVDLGEPDSFRHTFEEHVQALLQQKPGARQHPQSDRDRDPGVNPAPGCEFDDDGGDDHAHRSQHIAPHFEVCAFHVQARILARPELATLENRTPAAAKARAPITERLRLFI